jgi:hypothetical protein
LPIVYSIIKISKGFLKKMLKSPYCRPLKKEVQMAEAGSFDKADMAILETRKQETEVRAATKATKNVVPDMDRVEAKGYW